MVWLIELTNPSALVLDPAGAGIGRDDLDLSLADGPGFAIKNHRPAAGGSLVENEQMIACHDSTLLFFGCQVHRTS